MKAMIYLVNIALLLAMSVSMPAASHPKAAAGLWYVVPNGDDANDCLSITTACASINGVLVKASFNPGDTIYVGSGIFPGSSEQIVLIDKDAIVSGGWDETFTNQADYTTLDCENARRGMTIIGVSATIDHFKIQNCTEGIYAHTSNLIIDDSNFESNKGGAISFYGFGDEVLTMSNCALKNNTGAGGLRLYRGVGRIYDSIFEANTSDDGGGIYNNGKLLLSRIVIYGNDSSWSGGGISNYGWGNLEISDSTISNNSAQGSGGGVSNYDGKVFIQRSVISNNTSGGGYGGGVSSHGELTLINSTISGNSTQGIGGGISNFGTTTISNSTIVLNTAGEKGGGVYTGESSTAYITRMKNSILFENSADSGQDCAGTVESNSYNILGTIVGCDYDQKPGDHLDTDPRLFPLMGEPGYHPLAPCSPAVDGGNPAGCKDYEGNLLETDQRGVTRAQDGNLDENAVCDIGAYEYNPDNDPGACFYTPLLTRDFSPGFFDGFSDPSK